VGRRHGKPRPAGNLGDGQDPPIMRERVEDSGDTCVRTGSPVVQRVILGRRRIEPSCEPDFSRGRPPTGAGQAALDPDTTICLDGADVVGVASVLSDDPEGVAQGVVAPA
jgi:hypothetical protein